MHGTKWNKGTIYQISDQANSNFLKCGNGNIHSATISTNLCMLYVHDVRALTFKLFSRVMSDTIFVVGIQETLTNKRSLQIEVQV